MQIVFLAIRLLNNSFSWKIGVEVKLFFDLEATCWGDQYLHRQQEIIEFGAVLVNEYGEIEDRFVTFVRPIRHPYLSPYCKQLTGITQADVDSAEPFPLFYKRWHNWLHLRQEPVYFIAWGEGDARLWSEACDMHQLENPIATLYIDLKSIYHEMLNKFPRVGLKKALREEHIEFEGTHHRAYDDAYNLFRLYRKYIGQWPFH